jgi:hypothetical protein
VEVVLERFEEEYAGSLISRRLRLDTTGAGVAESTQEFLRQIWPHLSQVDRLRNENRTGISNKYLKQSS